MLERDLQHIGTKGERSLKLAEEEGATRKRRKKPMPQTPVVRRNVLCAVEMATKGCERAMAHHYKMSAAEEVPCFATVICGM